MSPFSVTVVDSSQATTVGLVGEVDLSSVEQMRKVIDDAIERDAQTVRLDLTGLAFMDSTGLAVVVEAHSRMRDQGRSLLVLVNDGAIKKLLALTGLSEHLNITDGDGFRDGDGARPSANLDA